MADSKHSKLLEHIAWFWTHYFRGIQKEFIKASGLKTNEIITEIMGGERESWRIWILEIKIGKKKFEKKIVMDLWEYVQNHKRNPRREESNKGKN